MKVLHIVNWYPSTPTPYQAPWIKKQIKSLNGNVQQDIIHIQILKGPIKIFRGFNDDNSEYLLFQFPFEIWRFNEVLSSVLVWWRLLVRKMGKKYDLINFHIAYPNCTYLYLFTHLIKAKILISEHWSAYHFNFGVKNKLPRLQRIFEQNIPVVTVSKALGNDIKEFSKSDFRNYIVPNVVGNEFVYKEKWQRSNNYSLFMLSQWKRPKDPFIILNACTDLVVKYPDVKLFIGGYGPQWDQIQSLIGKLNIADNIILLNFMSSEQIADQMRSSNAFIHCSHYETFSVVCAEALCCGTPVIASAKGGLVELIDNSNGVLVEEHSVKKWKGILETMINSVDKFDSEFISQNARNRYSSKKVGQMYLQVLKDVAA